MPDDTLFETKFHIQLDDGEVTFPLKVQRWAEKRGDAVGQFVLTFVVPVLKRWWVEYKTKQTMTSVDMQTDKILDEWEKEDEVKPEVVITEDASNPLGFSEMRISAPHHTEEK
jgi:hypothetical protein